ncbi:MAG: hypothetical protein ACRDLN_00510 [Solirubrobacteraceae bacterium]
MSHLRGLKPADDAPTLAAEVVDDELDRVDALSCATGRRTAAAQEPEQLDPQSLFKRLMEANAHEAALAGRQA